MQFQKLFLIGLASIALSVAVSTQLRAAPSKPHQIVVEVTSDSPESWEATLNNVENLAKALGSATSIEVVAHGKGLAMLVLAKDASARDRLQRISEQGTVFAACQNTMRHQNIKKEDLVPFAKTVDSGVAEVVRKQEAGWSYLKSGG